jgi:hypothetical protein
LWCIFQMASDPLPPIQHVAMILPPIQWAGTFFICICFVFQFVLFFVICICFVKYPFLEKKKHYHGIHNIIKI